MWIKNYILTLIILVLLTSFVEALMPNSSMKKHVSLMAGIVMILLIINPVIKLPDYLINKISFQLQYNQNTPDNNLSDKIVESHNELILSDFSINISGVIEKDISSQFDKLYKVDVLTQDNAITGVVLYGEEDVHIAEYIRKTYGFESTFK